MIKLRQCDGSFIELEPLLPDDRKGLVDYFFKMDSSWAIAVLNQINKDKIYDTYFRDKQYDTVIDLGAHIGLFSLCINKSAKQIYCLEPTPLHFEILKSLTRQYPHINIFNLAISNEDGTTDFFESTVNNTQNSIIQHGTTASLGQIQCLKLKTFLDQNNISNVDFLKMDIEGCEMIVFDDDMNWLKNRVKRIFLEVHNINLGKYKNTWDNNKDILVGKLSKIGYNIKVVKDAIYAEYP